MSNVSGKQFHRFDDNTIIDKTRQLQVPHINARYRSNEIVKMSIHMDTLKISNVLANILDKYGLPVDFDVAQQIIAGDKLVDIFSMLAEDIAKNHKKPEYKVGSIIREQKNNSDQGRDWIAVCKNSTSIDLPMEVEFEPDASCVNPYCNEVGQVMLDKNLYYCTKCNLSYKWVRKTDYER